MVQIELNIGPLAKRTRSSESDPEIIRTIAQPVSNTKAKKDRSKSKHNPAQSRAQEAGSSRTSTLIAHPNSGVQHAYNIAPVPGQHQLPLQQSSLPWWAWGLPPPPSQWNWNMWSPGAFHQLSPANQANQATIHQPPVAPNQFPGYSSVTTPANSTVTTASMTAGIMQHGQPATEASNLSQQSPSTSTNSVSPLSNPPDNGEEDEADPLVSALSFSAAPGKTHEPLLSMHVSASIKKRIWVGQYVDLASPRNPAGSR